MKVGIVAPLSWSSWGSFRRLLHTRLGRHDAPPPAVIPVGRTVIAPANGSLPSIVRLEPVPA